MKASVWDYNLTQDVMMPYEQTRDVENATAIFDTGMGGLSLVSAIHHYDPTEKLCFFSDNGRFPYGDQTPETATRWLIQIATFLTQRGVKKLLLGCNTVTAMTERELQKLSVPLEIKGPINPTVAAIATRLRNTLVLLFATDATLKMCAYQEKLARSDVSFIPMSGNGLERVIEKEPAGSNLLKRTADEAIQRVSQKIPETTHNRDIAVVLACTHFVLVEELLREIFKEKELPWRTFNPLPLIAESLIGPRSSSKIKQDNLHIFHTAKYNDEWWQNCLRFIPPDIQPATTREFVSFT